MQNIDQNNGEVYRKLSRLKKCGQIGYSTMISYVSGVRP